MAYAGIVSFGHRPFLTEVEQLESWRPDVAIVGAPFDIATTNRPGARFGPRAIRATAYEPGTYHLDLGLEIFDWLEVVDFGDAYCPHGQTEVSHTNIRERVHAVASRGYRHVVAVARFASSLLLGVLWATLGRGPAVYAYAAMLVLVIPAAWWLLRSLRPVEAVDAPAAEGPG